MSRGERPYVFALADSRGQLRQWLAAARVFCEYEVLAAVPNRLDAQMRTPALLRKAEKFRDEYGFAGLDLKLGGVSVWVLGSVWFPDEFDQYNEWDRAQTPDAFRQILREGRTVFDVVAVLPTDHRRARVDRRR